MAYNRIQVQNAIDALNRAQRKNDKAQSVAQSNRLGVDDDQDLEVKDVQAVLAYVLQLRGERDALIAQVKTVVAAWTP